MPELPEVHTITTDLTKHIIGAKILRCELINGYSATNGTLEFVVDTAGAQIVGAQRIAKNIVLELDSAKYIVVHLGMTGRLLLRSPTYKADGWERVVFKLEKNAVHTELRFCDKRLFGKLYIVDSAGLEALKQKYGPEPLDPNLTPSGFLNLLRSKDTIVKTALLDQKIVAGLGNVYATDALWVAQLHPQTRTKSLTLKQAETLLAACQELLLEGIEYRGISMSDYVDLFGKPGAQQNNFRVYQQKTCKRCATRVEIVQLAGRSTYFCPTCQPC